MLSPLLQLPQELRDLIYDHLFTDEDTTASHDSNAIDRQLKHLTTRHDRWQWDIHYAIAAPRATYLDLIRTNRQIREEVTAYLAARYREKAPAACLAMIIDYPNVTPTWTYLPTHPSQIVTLDITIKLDKMYHPCFISRPPHNAILHAVFKVLKTYLSVGPHLAKATPLHSRLHLETVRITLAPPQPLEDMTYIYGFPAQQLEVLYRDFRSYMARFARSTLPYGDIESFEIRYEGQEWERFAVTKEIWDEGDCAFFRNGGYRWSADVNNASE